MSKFCTNPSCTEYGNPFDDGFESCPYCGSSLANNIPVGINLGDANAISGGININQSKNISSHDTHFHSTVIQERVKSEGERKLDAANELRAKAQAIMSERGRLDSTAMAELKPLALKLGVDDETFKSIIKEVRSNRVGASNGLNAANGRYLLQAQQAVQTNDMDSLSNLTPRLEAMAAISQDDSVQYLHYMTLCILYPIKSMEVYEKQTDENYWRTFWAIVSYIRTGKYAEATKMLTQFDPVRYDKSEEDLNLLEAYFNIMKGEKDDAQEFLDEILDEPSSPIQMLLKAIEAKLYEEEPQNLEVKFYYERVMVKSDVVVNANKNVNQKSADVHDESTKSVSGKEEDKLDAQALYDKALLLHGKARFELLMLAAEMGLAQAQFEVANALSDDKEQEGCKMDLIESIKWFEKAAAQDYPPAHSVLGSIYLHIGNSQTNQLVARDYKKGEAEFLAAANAGEQMAMKCLCLLYKKSCSDEDPEKPEEAFKWAMKCSTVYLDEDTQRELGYMYLEGYGTERNVEQAKHWFEQAASTEDSESMNMLGNIYSREESVGIDYDKAFEWYEKAAKLGNADAMWNLACAYSYGQGCNIDKELSDKWLRMAAELGYEEAIKIINEKKSVADSDNIEEGSENAKHEPVGINDDTVFTTYDDVKIVSNANNEFIVGRFPSDIDDADFSKIVQLNESAHFLLEKFNKKYFSINDMTNSLLSEYEVEEEVAKNDVVNLVRGLFETGIVYVPDLEEVMNDILQKAEEAVSWKDYALAYKKFKEAEDMGNTEGTIRILEICKEALNYWKQNNCEDAIAILKPFAEAGHVESMDALGSILVDGHNLGSKNAYIDYSKGFQWQMKAAEAGYVFAMSNVGWCYENGRGVNKDIKIALEWYQKALDNGYRKDDWITERISQCQKAQPKVIAGDVLVYNDDSVHNFILGDVSLYNITSEKCRIKLNVFELPVWQRYYSQMIRGANVGDPWRFKISYNANEDNVDIERGETATFNYVLSVENKEDNTVLFQTKGTYCVKRVTHMFRKDEYVIL